MDVLLMDDVLTKKTEASHLELSTISAEFRKRAGRLKLGAYFFFSLIFPLFGVGAYVLYNASQITSFDIDGGGLDTKLNEASAEFEKLNARSQELGELIEWNNKKAREDLGAFMEKLRKKYPETVPNARPNNVIVHDPATPNEISHRIMEAMNKAEELPDGRIQLTFDLYHSVGGTPCPES
jgi:hypothetical protein